MSSELSCTSSTVTMATYAQVNTGAQPSVNNTTTPRRISTLQFDPTKIHKTPIRRDSSEDEECSGEGLLCQLCGEKFRTQPALDWHVRLHTVKEEYYERKCREAEANNLLDGDDYDLENVFGKLKRSIKKPRKHKYECSICHLKFTRKESIRSHMKMHSGDAPYQCSFCSKRFAHGSNLYRHLKIAHKDENASELCAKLMQEMNNHENRMVIYTGEKPKPYKCGFCNKQFRRLYRVKNHTRSHTGQKPFQCSVCNKVFSSSDCLYRHVKRVHNGGASLTKAQKFKMEEVEQPESETIKDVDSHTTIIQIDDGSGSLFSIPVRQSANNELTFLHSSRQGAEVFAIDADEQTGSGPTYYIDLGTSEITTAPPVNIQTIQQEHPQQHQQSHTELQHQVPDDVENDDCDDDDDDNYNDGVPEDNNAASNSPNKAFRCSLCGETFETSSLLTKHVSTHKFRLPSKCHICGKVFKQESYLKRHMICHTDERPFKCTLCPKAFKRQYRLSNHVRSHTGERPYACTICQKAFAISDGLYKHIKKVHGGNGIEYAAALVKQVQEMHREKKYAQLYGNIEVVDEEEEAA